MDNYILEFKEKGRRGYGLTTLNADNKEAAIEEAMKFINKYPNIERFKVSKRVYSKRIVYDSGKEAFQNEKNDDN